MKKVLFTATVDSHILHFHLPYLKMFKEKGYEVHVATNTDDTIPFCDVKHKVSFERSPFKINNLKAIKQMKKIERRNYIKDIGLIIFVTVLSVSMIGLTIYFYWIAETEDMYIR